MQNITKKILIKITEIYIVQKKSDRKREKKYVNKREWFSYKIVNVYIHIFSVSAVRDDHFTLP